MSEVERGEVSEAPPVAEDDLVSLLMQPRPSKQFHIPDAKGEPSEYFVRLRMWSGVERDSYYGQGMETMEVPLESGKRGDRATSVRFRQAKPGEKFRLLLGMVVEDYRLAVNGKLAAMKVPGHWADADWPVFRDLHPRLKDWLEGAISDFLGIEVRSRAAQGEEENSDQGEAPEVGSDLT